MTATEPRPRAVTIAFFCWLAAAILLILGGLLLVFSNGQAPVFFRGAGVVWIVTGALLSYLAGRARGGDTRFRRAAVALSIALALLLALFAVMSSGLVWLFVLILVLVGAVVIMRPAAQQWYVPSDAPESNA
jgi:peptidoglycan/LPS O-acetylase OafA/YrhL